MVVFNESLLFGIADWSPSRRYISSLRKEGTGGHITGDDMTALCGRSSVPLVHPINLGLEHLDIGSSFDLR